MTLNILFIWYLAFYFFVIPKIIASENNTLEEKPNITDFPPENVCTTKECHRLAEHILHNMDRHVDPCDDFYKFACGGYRIHTTLPTDKIRSVDSYATIEDMVKNQLRDILEEESPPDEMNAFRQMKNFYKSCMNTNVIKEKGLKHFWDTLEPFGGWPVLKEDKWNETKFNWIEIINKLNDVGYIGAYFIHLSSSVNPTNSSERILSLSFDMRFDSDNTFVKRAMSLGAENVTWVKKEVTRVQALEYLLASFTKPDDQIRISLADLTLLAPDIPWKKYLRSLLPANVVIDDSTMVLVDDPAYINKMTKLINAVPKRNVANYIIYKALFSNLIMVIDKALRTNTHETTSDFDKNRWEFCLATLSFIMPLNIDALYVRKHFDEDTRRSITEIAENIRRQFKIILQNADWMDNTTRNYALDKIDSMNIEVGYSDALIDYSELEKRFEGIVLDENEYLQNSLKVSRSRKINRFSVLRDPYISPYTSRPTQVNVYTRITDNLVFALLQDYFFHKERPKYLNYGAIGNTIGHEITHGFSDVGRKYDKDGNLFNWWTPADEKTFMSKAQCLIDQYENYTVEGYDGWHLNGTITLNENIADNGGFKIAYLAYKDWAKKTNEFEPTLPGLPYNPNQMFWIMAANQYCSVYQKQWLDHFIDTHSIEELRILGSMSNILEFAEDFRCPAGSKMNPKKKCSVW